jgi:hypothetical protein
MEELVKKLVKLEKYLEMKKINKSISYIDDVILNIKDLKEFIDINKFTINKEDNILRLYIECYTTISNFKTRKIEDEEFIIYLNNIDDVVYKIKNILKEKNVKIEDEEFIQYTNIDLKLYRNIFEVKNFNGLYDFDNIYFKYKEKEKELNEIIKKRKEKKLKQEKELNEMIELKVIELQKNQDKINMLISNEINLIIKEIEDRIKIIEDIIKHQKEVLKDIEKNNKKII